MHAVLIFPMPFSTPDISIFKENPRNRLTIFLDFILTK